MVAATVALNLLQSCWIVEADHDHIVGCQKGRTIEEDGKIIYEYLGV